MPLPYTMIAPVPPLVVELAASSAVAISTHPFVVVFASEHPAVTCESTYPFDAKVVDARLVQSVADGFHR